LGSVKNRLFAVIYISHESYHNPNKINEHANLIYAQKTNNYHNIPESVTVHEDPHPGPELAAFRRLIDEETVCYWYQDRADMN